MKDKEIEIKIQLTDHEKFISWLRLNGRLIEDCHHESDTYYCLPGTNGKWLRLREKEGLCEMSYKCWHRAGTGESLYADEIETTVGSARQVAKMLSELGFEENISIVKVRESWSYGGLRFDCDDVGDIGRFVDVELLQEVSDPREGRSLIFRLLRELGLGEWRLVVKGYGWIVKHRHETYYEE